MVLRSFIPTFGIKPFLAMSRLRISLRLNNWAGDDRLAQTYLRQQVVHNVSEHISQSIPPTLMPKRQTFMIDTKEVKNGRLKIVYMCGVVSNIVPEFVGLSVRKPLLYTPPVIHNVKQRG